jgi:hypothetical protein
MFVPSRSTVVVVFGIVASLGVLGCQALGPAGESPAGAPVSATVVGPPRTTTYHVRDANGQTVAVTVPAMDAQRVNVSNAAAGTVPATVMALDAQTSQAEVRTQKGQRLVLALPPELLARMRVGDHFTLQVVRPSGQ